MNTEEMIKVMQAYEDGKTIEVRCLELFDREDTYSYASSPAWNWLSYEYRVKPVKLQPVYAIYNDDGTLYNYSNLSEVMRDASIRSGKEVVVLTKQDT